MKQFLSLTDSTGFLRPATWHTDATGAWLELATGSVGVQADLALRFAGTPARSAEARLLPLSGPDPAEDVLDLRLTTPYVLFGDTGFGLGLPAGLVLYDSATAPASSARERASGTPVGRPRPDHAGLGPYSLEVGQPRRDGPGSVTRFSALTAPAVVQRAVAHGAAALPACGTQGRRAPARGPAGAAGG